MKVLKLTLSDSAYTTALELAGRHGIPVEAYISGEVEDKLDKLAENNGHSEPSEHFTSTQKHGPPPSFRSVMPDTLAQVFDVCKYVYRSKSVPDGDVHARAEFRDAVRTVAKSTGVGETTVRDKCCTTRRLGLPDVPVDTDKFIMWLCKPEALRDHLCRKFPNFAAEIHKRFAEWLPSRFGNG